MLTKFLIIYSTDQKVRRAVVKCSDDAQYNAWKKSNSSNGLGWLMVPVEEYNAFNEDEKSIGNTLDVFVAARLGNPKSDKCVIVHGDGSIKGAICADPRIDDHPDGFLIQDIDAVAGDTFDFETGKVTKKYVEPVERPFEVKRLEDGTVVLAHKNGDIETFATKKEFKIRISEIRKASAVKK
ncbi:hypothetical protein KAR91_59855 [Candidatus Pacearchaeota archaeon]|nr:hypothetical protein [Candidatus Pacearchaeota archaeon]